MNDAQRQEYFKSHRNAEQIRSHAMRVVQGRIPREVRNELMEAVRDGMLGRLPKNGLLPEVFFHPDHRHGAIAKQKSEAAYAVSCVASVMVSPGEFRAGIEAMGGDVEGELIARAAATSRAAA